MEEDYIEIDLKEIFQILKINIIKISILTVVAALLGFAVSEYLIAPKYEASKDLIVNSRVEGVATVSNDNITTAKNLVSTYAVVIKSNIILDRVISNLHLDYDYEQLYKMVNVSPVDSTQIMRITVTSTDSEEAVKIVEQICKIAPAVIVDKVEAGSCKEVSNIMSTGKPVSPSVKKNVLISAFIGCFIVCAFCVLKELLSNCIENDNDIEKYIDLPLIGVIPEIE